MVSEYVWRLNAFAEGFPNYHGALYARLLDPELDGWFLSNRPFGESAVAVQFPSGMSNLDRLFLPKLAEGNFPYGYEVEPAVAELP